MTNLVKGTLEDKTAISHAIDLLTHYSFDLGNRTAQQLLDQWLKSYQAGWVRWAVIEALYQGRYKAVSVDQILQLWQRRKHPCYHFSYEFERLVCHKFPRNLSQYISDKPNISDKSIAAIAPNQAVLPALPSSQPREVDQFKPPSWSDLAEQTHRDEVLLQNSPIVSDSSTPDPHSLTAVSDDDHELVQESLVEESEVLPSRSAARIQAGMDALINQATSSLNASTEAGKTKLLTDETRHTINALRGSTKTFVPAAQDISVPAPIADSQNHLDLDETEGAEDPHPPIHQFTPAPDGTDFHSKLKAVVEQQPKDLH